MLLIGFTLGLIICKLYFGFMPPDYELKIVCMEKFGDETCILPKRMMWWTPITESVGAASMYAYEVVSSKTFVILEPAFWVVEHYLGERQFSSNPFTRFFFPHRSEEALYASWIPSLTALGTFIGYLRGVSKVKLLMCAGTVLGSGSLDCLYWTLGLW